MLLSVISLGPKTRHIILCVRMRTDPFHCKRVCSKSGASCLIKQYKLVWGLLEFTYGIWLGICVMQWTLNTVSISCSLEGTMSGIKLKKKVDIRSPNTDSLSVLDCLFRTDFSCKHRRTATSSCLAKLSSQMGGLVLPPPFFVL